MMPRSEGQKERKKEWHDNQHEFKEDTQKTARAGNRQNCNLRVISYMAMAQVTEQTRLQRVACISSLNKCVYVSILCT